jgi:hypothetical protein
MRSGAFTGANQSLRPLRAGRRRHAVSRRNRRHADGGADPFAARAAAGRIHDRRRPHADQDRRAHRRGHQQGSAQLIQQGLFREDLFFRLNVVPLRLPPLRERGEDIPDLIRHFFAQGEKRRPAAQDARHRRWNAEAHRWPGNVRELENLARRLAALHPGRDHAAPSTANWQPPNRDLGRQWRRRRRSTISAAPSKHLSSLFRPQRALPPPGLYHRILQEVEVPLLTICAGGHPRQPDPRRGSAGPQSQHAAQEDPRSGVRSRLRQWQPRWQLRI